MDVVKRIVSMVDSLHGVPARIDQMMHTIEHLSRKVNTVAGCPTRFCGEYDDRIVARFINNVQAYKAARGFGDAESLHNLQHLLLDHAHDWWLIESNTLTSWQHALDKLSEHFSHEKNSNELFKQFLLLRYEGNLKEFVLNRKFLLVQIPGPKLCESAMVSLIYSQLPQRLRDRIPRNTIETLDEFMNMII